LQREHDNAMLYFERAIQVKASGALELVGWGERVTAAEITAVLNP
jgi:hypothetical protein